MTARLYEAVTKGDALLVRLDEAKNARREAFGQAGEAGWAMADCLERLPADPYGERLEDSGAITVLATKQARAEAAEQSALTALAAVEDEVLAFEPELNRLVIEAGRVLLDALVSEAREAAHDLLPDTGLQGRRAYDRVVALLKGILAPVVVPGMPESVQRDELMAGGAPPDEQVIAFFMLIGRHLSPKLVPAADGLSELGRVWDAVSQSVEFIEAARADGEHAEA